MSKLDELIRELCPDGVEYKRTKEIKKKSFWLMPSTPHYQSEGIPYITSKNIKNSKIDFDNVNYISKEDFISISSNRKIQKNDLLITMIGTIGETAFVEVERDFYGQNMYLIRLDENVINRKFYNYFISSKRIQNSLISRKNASSQGYIKAGSIEELSVPVPPLEVQEEIVRILDNFTELTAELTAELTVRQKQYTYYRDYLLSFDKDDNLSDKIVSIDTSNVQCMKLGDIVNVERGTRVVRKQLSEVGKYPVFQNSLSPLGYYDKYNRNALTTYVIGAGAAGEIGFSDIDFWAADDCYTFDCPKELNSRYLYFVLLSQKSNIASKVRKSSIPRLPRTALENLIVPLPSIETQNKIVSILNRFDELCNGISEGLPAEIEARKKQYEYYRDVLLSFDEKLCSQIVKVERERELSRSKALKWLELNKIFELKNGYTPSKNKSEYWDNGIIPWFRMDDIRTNGRILNDSIQHITESAVKGGKLFPANSIILSTSATIGEHALITVPSLANQRFTYVTVKDEYKEMLNMKFVFYYFFKVGEWCKNNLNISSFASVDMDKLKNLKFPIPPLEEQQRIVSILDRFDKLCNDISEGLPAEINARQKQYEYYRDKLLTFKEKKTV